VSITPIKRPRQQHEEDEHPFTDEEFDAYKVWLEELPLEQSKGISSMFLRMYSYCLECNKLCMCYT
jgi:hypothetical protein